MSVNVVNKSTGTLTRIAGNGSTIQTSVMPTASAFYEGKTYQYIGATNQNYTHNYFYECVSNGEVPPTYSWQQTNVQPDSEIATTEKVGVVKPDDMTIFINSEGTIRTKVWAGTLAQYSQVKDVLNNDTTIIITDADEIPTDDIIVNGVKIVSWATGSWADISAMLDGHDAGKINIYDYWAIGDKRSVHVNAITGNPSGGLTTDIPAQDVYLVLMNEGYMSQTGIHYAVGQLDCLSIKGRINADPNATGAWRDSDIRTDLNGRYYNALPSDFKAITKTFDVTTGESLRGDSGTVQITQDKVALFAQKEIFGENTTQYYRTVPAENTALFQIEYFENPENRIKYIASSGSKIECEYWQRSPINIEWGDGIFGATGLTQGKAPAKIYGRGGEQLNGIAPFFCI